MSHPWFFLDSGAGEPAENMALDEILLQKVRGFGAPILRLYGWSRAAATFGYFQRYAEIERLTETRPLIRRPTGGGLVPHGGDWTYSLAVPPTHEWYGFSAWESYERIHSWVRGVFARLNITTELSPMSRTLSKGQCFIGAEKFDVLLQGEKIAGAAQRRNRFGLLIQGSVQPGRARAALSDDAWQEAFREEGSTTMNIKWQPFFMDAASMNEVRSLAEQKYGAISYNQKR